MDSAKAARLLERIAYLEAAHWVASRSTHGDIYVARPGTHQYVRDPEQAEQMSRTPGPFDQLMSVRDIEAELAQRQRELEKVRNA